MIRFIIICVFLFSFEPSYSKQVDQYLANATDCKSLVNEECFENKENKDEKQLMDDFYNWQPLREMQMVQERFNTLFNSLVDTRDLRGFVDEEYEYSPALDIKESSDSYELSLDMPGFSKENISISYENNEVIVSGTRDTSVEEVNGSYHKKERHLGSYKRIIPLPGNADASKATANYNNGVLKITLPKKEIKQEPGIKIEVK